VGEGLVVESAVAASSSIGSNGAEEAFFDGDAAVGSGMVGTTMTVVRVGTFRKQ